MAKARTVLQRDRKHASGDAGLTVRGTQFACTDGIVWEIVLEGASGPCETFTVRNDLPSLDLPAKALEVVREAIERWQAHPQFCSGEEKAEPDAR